LPPLCFDLVVESVGDDLFCIRYTDLVGHELVSADVDLDDLRDWERLGAPPEQLQLHRQPLDDAVAAAKVKLDRTAAELDEMKRRWPGIGEDEWF
jgi:hypothetical protein